MGKKNLTLVGAHEDYLADMFDDRTGLNPSLVKNCASPEDAAISYFRSVFENSNALVRYAVVAVWPAIGTKEATKIFDLAATLTHCLESDAEPGEVDVAFLATLRA